MKRRRCLIPADGFYEWSDHGSRKRPYVVRPRAGGPIAFAGLWESWMGPNGEEMETAAIITTEANSDVAHIHHRMPVVIPQEAFDLWLDPNADAAAVAALIAPAPVGLLEAYEISTAVNRVANDSPELLEAAQAEMEPVPQASGRPKLGKKPKKDERQASLF
jgi:putative SOS response-associated peptidase YedK